MVAQHTGQYDDDLTVGADEYKESFSTDFVDLFEPLGDDDAPIAKLKTIILSIDWEITDDILDQLNAELLDLKDVWSGNKINLIYVQALEKIGRYIYSEKAHSHPNAIKLLLAFYYNLEKIVSSGSMTEEQKKQLLLQDIKKFDHFKAQVDPAREKKSFGAQPPLGVSAAEDSSFSQEKLKNLTNLKAIVEAIDGKSREAELVQLSQEVSRLEKIFSESKAKLILLQGLGALANYILLNKSSAHPDAVKLLHSFYQGLERIHAEVLSTDQEKAILVAEVKKFKAFKALIAKIAAEVVVVAADDSEPAEDDEDNEESGDITPAFADMPADSRGFRDDGEPFRSDINKRLASFFGETEAETAEQLVEVTDQTDNIVSEGFDVDSRLDSLFGEDEEVEPGAEASDLALSGVNVETEEDDDSDEMALPVQRGKLAPALVDISDQSLYAEEEASAKAPPPDSLNHEPFIPGLDVESDADDDSEEAALPFDHQGVAPALVFSDEEYGFRESEFAADSDEGESDLEDRLDSFFGPEITESGQDNISQATADEESGPVIISESLRQEKEEEKPAPEILGSDEEESPVTSEFEWAEDQELLAAETSAGNYKFAPIVTDILFEEVAGEKPASVSTDMEVVFEPVGDDVEVDELPLDSEDIAADTEMAAAQASLAALHDSIASILVKKYDVGFPLFFTEINNLYQRRQAQHINNIFLQLLETVGRYIETCREGADSEALSLFQSLDHNLERIFEPQSGYNDEPQQILFEETGKVLLWQQRLIFSLAAQSGRKGE